MTPALGLQSAKMVCVPNFGRITLSRPGNVRNVGFRVWGEVVFFLIWSSGFRVWLLGSRWCLGVFRGLGFGFRVEEFGAFEACDIGLRILGRPR